MSASPVVGCDHADAVAGLPSVRGRKSTPKPARCRDRPGAPRSDAAVDWRTPPGWILPAHCGASPDSACWPVLGVARWGADPPDGAASVAVCAESDPARHRPGLDVRPSLINCTDSRRSGALIIRPRPSPRAPRLFFAAPEALRFPPGPHLCGATRSPAA
ncbi:MULTISPECIES: hypothetical protein [Marinomonas]|uniref:hypothetical protein n=1 Tax=Marinomonas TaxID=28253 RepID=UPI001114E3F5|nr:MULTISPECIES: hypothetical protein [Marinomonas]